MVGKRKDGYEGITKKFGTKDPNLFFMEVCSVRSPARHRCKSLVFEN